MQELIRNNITFPGRIEWSAFLVTGTGVSRQFLDTRPFDLQKKFVLDTYESEDQVEQQVQEDLDIVPNALSSWSGFFKLLAWHSARRPGRFGSTSNHQQNPTQL